MADDPTPDPTPADPKEPKADPPKPETDWKAEARKWETRAKENATAAARLQELENAQKSAEDRAKEAQTAAEKRAADAELRAMRLEVAATKGLTPAQAKRLVGTTAEELEADADELLSTFAPAAPGEPKPTPAGKPREHLKAGSGDPDQPVEETDVKALGARMFAS